VRTSRQVAAVTFGLCALSAGAQTQWIYAVSAPTEVEHDSNPRLSPGASASVRRLRIAPALAASYKAGRDDFSVSGAVSLETSNDTSLSANRADPRLRAEWKRTGEVFNYGLLVSVDRRAYRATDIDAPVPIGVDGTRMQMSLGGNWVMQFGDRSSIAADLRFDDVNHDVGSIADYRLTAGSARYAREVSERLTWYAGTTLQVYRPAAGPAMPVPAPSLGGSEAMGLMAGARTQVTQSLEVDGNAGFLRFTGGRNDTDWQGSVRATYQSQRLTGLLELSRSPSPSPQAGVLEINQAFRVQASYALSERSRVQMELARGKIGGAAGRALTHMTLGWTTDLTPDWQFAVKATHRRQEQALVGQARANILSLALVYSRPDF
jgi:hypothetical protein